MLQNIGLGGLIMISLVLLLLFGRGRIASMMAEVGGGISSFKRGLRSGEAPAVEDKSVVERDRV